MDTQRKNKRKRPEKTQNQEPAEQLAALVADKALQEMLQADFTDLLKTEFEQLAKELAELDTLQ